MRIKNSIKNMISSFFSNTITIIIGVVAQAVFLKILNSEYLGINSLFANIISMLSIVELGMSNAIIFNLYKPVAENDKETIKSLMKFYKKSYSIIGIIILIFGILVIPFLKYIVNYDEITIPINILYVYFIFLIDAVVSYFISYKRSILIANQKNHIINTIHIIYTILLNLFQIIILFVSENYYLYLIIKFIMRVIENIAITTIANKKYSFIKDKDSKKLEKNIENDIFKKIKALFIHKIGGFIVLSTDNILISKMFGLISVGLYANYYLIINSVQTVVSQIMTSITPSVGNLLVTEKKEKQFKIFNRIKFLNFYISCITSIMIFALIEPFISIWIGKQYLIDQEILITLIISYYLNSTKSSVGIFKEAAGIYYEDRFVPLIEGTVNLLFSIILGKVFGLSGIFLGTILSSLVLWLYSYYKFVYKKLFDLSYLNYTISNLKYLFVFIIILIISIIFNNFVIIDNNYLKMFVNIIYSLIIPNIVIIILFNKTENFRYYYEMLKERLWKKVKVKE